MVALKKKLKKIKACDLLQIAILVAGVSTYLVNRQSETLWVMVAIQVSALVVFKLNQQRKKIISTASDKCIYIDHNEGYKPASPA